MAISNASNWVNDLAEASSKSLLLLNVINDLYTRMLDNAALYHKKFYANEDPPVDPPPAISDQQAMKNWLVAMGVVGTFPSGITEDDYWLAALALNGIRNSVSEDDRKALTWVKS